MQKDFGDGAAPRLETPQAHHASPPVSHGGWSVVQVPDGPGHDKGTQSAQARPKLPSPPETLPPGQDDIDLAFQQAEKQTEQLSALREASSSFQRRYGKLVHLREEAYSMRTRMQFEWRNCADHRRFVSESQRLFLEEATAFCDTLPPELSTERLQILRSQFQRDHERQVEHDQKTSEMETEVGNLQYSLQQRELQVTHAAQRMADILSQLSLPGYSGAATVIETENSSLLLEAPPEEVPVFLQHYFEKAGDVNIVLERILDLELDQKEAHAARQLQIDQDLPLTLTDEEFEDVYLRAYAQAELELAEAKNKAELAKAVCLSERLDPDNYPKLPSEQDKGRTETPVPSETAAMPNTPSSAALEPTEEVQTPSRLHLFQPVNEARPVSMLDRFAPNEPLLRRGKDDPTSFNERMQNWIETIPNEETTPRSRSVSDSRPVLTIFEIREDGTLGFNRAFARARRYKRQESLASYMTSYRERLATGEDGEGRPSLLKRSSSESQLSIPATQHGSRQAAFDSLRAPSVRASK